MLYRLDDQDDEDDGADVVPERPPVDCCSSCGSATVALVALDSPTGEYLLCGECIGDHGVQREIPLILAPEPLGLALDDDRKRRAAVADVLSWYDEDGVFRTPPEVVERRERAARAAERAAQQQNRPARELAFGGKARGNAGS